MDLRNEEWWFTEAGTYQTGAVEAMKADGSQHQHLIVLEWPTRLNNGTEKKTIRLAMAPEDAIGLAQVLAHSAGWLLAQKEANG